MTLKLPTLLVAHLLFLQRTDQRKKNQKSYQANAQRQTAMHDRQARPKKNNEPLTAPTKNWRFSASYDSFVVNQTFVLRMNICGKNRHLLVAANRV